MLQTIFSHRVLDNRGNRATLISVLFDRARLTRLLRTNVNFDARINRRGNYHQNVVAGSFFSSIKLERIKKKVDTSCDEAKADLVQYIEGCYIYRRRDSNIDSSLPKQFGDTYIRTLEGV